MVKSKRGILPRNILINTVIVLVPIILMISILLPTYVDEGIIWYADNERLAMQQSQSNIEQVMQEFSETAMLIATDQEMNSFQIQENGYGVVYAIKRLNHYRANISSLSDLIICLNDSSQIYRATGTESLDTFLEKGYQLKDEAERKMLTQFMNSRKTFGILMPDAFSSAGNFDYILITYPLTSLNQQQYGTLIGMLKSSFFDTNLIESEIDSQMLICRADGTPIYSSDVQNAAISAQLPALLNDYREDESFYPLSCDGEEYMVILSKSDITGWYYMRLIRYEELKNAFYGSKGGLLAALVTAVIALSVIMGTVIAVYHYYPIRSLFRLFSDNVETKEKYNELMLLNDYICDLQKQCSVAEKKLADMGQLRVREIITWLLRGNGNPTERDLKVLEQYGFAGERQYCIVVLACEREGDQFSNLVLMEELSSPECENLLFVMQEPQGYFVLLYSGFAGGNDAELAATQLCERMAENGYQLRAGIGKSTEQIEDLRESLNEAFLALEIDAQQTVVVFEQLLYSREDEPFWYPLRDEFLLRLAIREGKKEDILEKLNVLKETLRRTSHHYREYELRSILCRVMNYALDFPGASDRHLREAMKKMAGYSSPDAFFEAFAEYIVSETGEKVYAVNEVKGTQFKEIIEFIDENYCDPEMSLAYAADHFGFGGVYLSKIFKNNMDINFGDYLSEKRMEKGRQLLLETQMSLQQIVESIGYSDVPSFSRKFSKKYGMSPGNYRKAMK